MSDSNAEALAAEASGIGHDFFGRSDSALSRALLFIAEMAREHEELATRAPLRKATRHSLERAALLAEKLAELLTTAPLNRLNGSNGFLAAAREAQGDDAVTVSPDMLYATAAGARALLSRIGGGQGAARISDALGNPRGRLICAVAAVRLVEWHTGARPGKTNPIAQALARRLWHLAGGSDTAAVAEGEKDELAAWERHIRAARAQDADVADATLLAAKLLVAQGISLLDRGDANPPHQCD